MEMLTIAHWVFYCAATVIFLSLVSFAFKIRSSYVLSGSCSECGSKFVLLWQKIPRSNPLKINLKVCMCCGHEEDFDRENVLVITKTHDLYLDYLSRLPSLPESFADEDVNNDVFIERSMYVEEGIIRQAQADCTIRELAENVGCSLIDLIQYVNDLAEDDGLIHRAKRRLGHF